MTEFDAMLDALDAKDREVAAAEALADSRRDTRHAYWRERPHVFKEEDLLPGYCWRCGRLHEEGVMKT